MKVIFYLNFLYFTGKSSYTGPTEIVNVSLDIGYKYFNGIFFPTMERKPNQSEFITTLFQFITILVPIYIYI